MCSPVERFRRDSSDCRMTRIAPAQLPPRAGRGMVSQPGLSQDPIGENLFVTMPPAEGDPRIGIGMT